MFQIAIAPHRDGTYPKYHMRSLRRTLGLPIVLASLVLAAGCNTSNPPMNPTTGTVAPAAPQPATVTQRDIVGQVVLTGQIVVPPAARADLNPPFRATVNKVDKNVGAEVGRGDLLVELAMPSAEAYHEQTKQAVKDAQTAYDSAKLQNQPAVDAAQKALDAARAGVKTANTAAATGGVAPADATSGAPASDTSQAVTDRAAAEQNLPQAKADMASQLLPYKQQLEEARQANLQARASEKQGNLRSPIGGTVTALNAQPGKEVSPDVRTPVATVIDLNALQVQSTMTPQQAGYVKPRMRVTLTFDEIPDKTFEGKVFRMTSQPNNTSYVAIISFENTGDKVRPGMKPHAAIKTGKEVKGALAIPVAAVRVDSTGKPTVSVMRDGKWQAVTVQPGISDGQFIEIKSELKSGETVQVGS